LARRLVQLQQVDECPGGKVTMADSTSGGVFPKVVETLDAYLERPIGTCLCGPSYAIWWRDPTLKCIVFWGRPDEDDISRITRALDAELERIVTPHASFVDTRRVRAVDLGAFTTLSQYLFRRREPFTRFVARQALVRPEGLAGAAVAGFYAVLAPAYPVGVFTETAEALQWLGVVDAAHVARQLEEIYAMVTASSTVLVALRAHLDRRLGTTTVAEAASALGMSARQLQRKLHEAHTSFQQEDAAARIRAAQTLLLETNYEVKRIAIEVGCASLQHFCMLFRKEVGETPSQWRAQRSDGVATTERVN
jgi:AraC-like DNA-binding protein